MNYVVAAWICCAVILLAYTVRMVRRERSLRRSLAPGAFLAPPRPKAPSPGPAVATSAPGATQGGALAAWEPGTWT
jgi:hypothetical protein